MEGLVQITALLLICLMFVIIGLQQRKNNEGFESVPAKYNEEIKIMTSEIPDLCSSLNAVDCNKTLGCEWSADVGLCVKRHEVRDAAAHGNAMRAAIEQFENYMPDSGPQPANAQMY